MPSFSGAAQGASSAAATGNPYIIAGAALLGGLFGGKQKLSPEQKFQMGIAKDLRKFSKSVPLSDAGEQMGLAQQHALLGQQQQSLRQNLYNQQPGNVTTSPADFAMGIGAQEVSQRVALDSQALMDAFLKRREAMLQAAQVAQGVGPRQQEPGIGGMLGNLAQQYSAYHTARQGQQQYQQYLDILKQRGGTGGIAGPQNPQIRGFQGSLGQMSGRDLTGTLQMPGQPPSRPDLFNPVNNLGGGTGQPRPNGGNGIPMQPPPGSGFGIPSQNYNPAQNTLDLFSRFQAPYGLATPGSMLPPGQGYHPWSLPGFGSR
jgi:hypothetical protein